jgi:DNA repair protein RadA/Sms
MIKNKTIYQCQTCGHASPKWLGKCPSCEAWNSFVEERQEGVKNLAKSPPSDAPVPIADITVGEEDRIGTGISELDRVLGGGIVSGSLTLIGGDPGIGKSTIVLQMLQGIYIANAGISSPALYVSGEESLKQIKLRSNRLGLGDVPVNVLSETCLENILDCVRRSKPSVIVIDSVQTIYTMELPSAPGSVGQVRECAAKLMHFAKKSSVPVFLVGHVTKEGAIAGPRVLEHIVDTVLYFEGERGHAYRILRAVKNRFGSTNEIGVFEMQEGGLKEITNPSELFLAERPESASGTIVVSTIEGTRPLMVELQALVTQSNFGTPRRTGIGVDLNRVNLLVAVLEKIGGLHLGNMDIFLNVVGGLKVSEPAFDLGIVISMASSFRDVLIGPDVLVFGEVGLSGEVRAVSQAEIRLKEGEKIGFKRAVLPLANLRRLNFKPAMELTGVRHIDEALGVIVSR